MCIYKLLCKCEWVYVCMYVSYYVCMYLCYICVCVCIKYIIKLYIIAQRFIITLLIGILTLIRIRNSLRGIFHCYKVKEKKKSWQMRITSFDLQIPCKVCVVHIVTLFVKALHDHWLENTQPKVLAFYI